MARKGLPKKYAKMGFKRGWKLYKATLRGNPKPRAKTKAKPRRQTMAKKKKSYRRKSKNILGMFTSKTAVDGYIAKGGVVVVNKFFGVNNPLVNAGITGAVGIVRNNNTLIGQSAVELISALIPQLNGGSNGALGGYEE